MNSRAFSLHEIGLARAKVLYKTVGAAGLRPQPRREAEAILHASLTSATAAWNFYLPNLIRDFRDAVANPLDIQFSAMHSLVTASGDEALAKFNTPNAENSRKLLVAFTGYDPIGDWIWPQRQLTGVATRERLNEILKVRHSFAHGFSMPGYPWMQGPGG